jgi:hypothetical protein
MRRAPLARLFWIGAAALLGVAALVAIAAVVRGEVTETDGRILASLGSALLAGGCLVSGLALKESGRAGPVGWAAVVISPVALAVILRTVWAYEGDGESENLWRSLWSAVLVLVATLLAATAFLLARLPLVVRVAAGASALIALGAAWSIAAIWTDEHGDGTLKAIATLWILGVLAWFLVPVLGRLLSAPQAPGAERVLASEGDVELVATRAADAHAIEPRLQPGERLLLRRRADG